MLYDPFTGTSVNQYTITDDVWINGKFNPYTGLYNSNLWKHNPELYHNPPTLDQVQCLILYQKILHEISKRNYHTTKHLRLGQYICNTDILLSSHHGGLTIKEVNKIYELNDIASINTILVTALNLS